ncbi:MAG TPA: MarR family transcriptional regulator [Candidatus Jeotgalibaca pullicola]|nr:MarR family transcriptional regulator [Candidatus Jeotgalibaca pullicola]
MIKSRGRKNVYWGAFILEWFKYLQDNDLTSSDFKVLFYLCEKMNLHENKAYLRQKMIAEELKMDKGNVSKCIKRLCEKQFIAKMDNGFMINPHLFYVGKRHPVDRWELRETFDQLLEEKNLLPLFELNEEDSCLEYRKNRVDQEGFGF